MTGDKGGNDKKCSILSRTRIIEEEEFPMVLSVVGIRIGGYSVSSGRRDSVHFKRTGPMESWYQYSD